MKFHCNRCNKDFTTLAERDKGKKFGFSHLIMDRMKCAFCGASNASRVLRPLKKTRNRYQPKRRMVSDDDAPPSIVLHQDCRSRLTGSLYSPEGYEVVCEGCKCVFNCWTGNVDDGEYIAPITTSMDEQRKEAVIKVEKKKVDDELQWLLDERKKMGKLGFSYEFRKQTWYARFGGTIWKLNPDDVQSIRECTWDTPQTIIIKRTFDNKGIKATLAKSLLVGEILIQSRG